MRGGAFSVVWSYTFKCAVEKELKINSTNDKKLQISIVWQVIFEVLLFQRTSKSEIKMCN